MKNYTEEYLASILPVPHEPLNKYSRGKLTVVAGSARYPGAACLASLASQRAGAGYTEVVSAPEVVGILHGLKPSLVGRSWEEEISFSVQSTGEKPCAFLVGSGFDPHDPHSHELTLQVLDRAQAPVLCDGGAFDTLVTEDGRRLCEKRSSQNNVTVLTPHEGEAARLAHPFGLKTSDSKRLSLLLANSYHSVVVLKGSTTFISDGENVFTMSEGTSALAKAGTGDVLAGIIGAFLAQGMAADDACVLGTILHARAGRVATEKLTSISVVAEDVIDALPHVLANLTR